jgi:hypothetical protein
MRNFRILVLTFVAGLIFCISEPSATAAPSTKGPVGLGIVLGDPAGLSLRTELNRHNALQLHVGFDLEKFDRTRVVLALDYLFYFTQMFKSVRSHGRLNPYVGLGSAIQLKELSSEFKLGIRVPVGLSFHFLKAPVELFAEVALGVHVLPKTATLIDGGLGVRWYF